MEQERSVWSGTPSQVVNLPAFILLGLIFWLVIPLFVILWKWLAVKYTKYELTTERLRMRHGVLNKETDDLELYRVRDYKLVQPFWLRLFSLGNVVLQTSDRSHPVVTIKAIRDGDAMRELLRKYVEQNRVRKQVREVDFE